AAALAFRGGLVCSGRAGGAEILLLRADGRLVDLKLVVLSDLVVKFVPAVLDGLHGRVLIDLAGQEARHGFVLDYLLILLILWDTQVEDHVRAVKARLNSAEVV